MNIRAGLRGEIMASSPSGPARTLLDQRLTLLHELAHWLTPASRRRRGVAALSTTGAPSTLVAFGLYRRHGITDADALRLESGRYRSALRHAAALGVPGAAEALAEHRARLRARPRRRWTVLVAEHAVRLRREGRWHVCAHLRSARGRHHSRPGPPRPPAGAPRPGTGHRLDREVSRACDRSRCPGARGPAQRLRPGGRPHRPCAGRCGR